MVNFRQIVWSPRSSDMHTTWHLLDVVGSSIRTPNSIPIYLSRKSGQISRHHCSIYLKPFSWYRSHIKLMDFAGALHDIKNHGGAIFAIKFGMSGYTNFFTIAYLTNHIFKLPNRKHNFKGPNVTKGKIKIALHTHTQFHHSNIFREDKTFQHLLVYVKKRKSQFEHFVSNKI